MMAVPVVLDLCVFVCMWLVMCVQLSLHVSAVLDAGGVQGVKDRERERARECVHCN